MLLSMVLNSSSPSLCHPLLSWLVSGRAARPCRTAGWKRGYGAWKGHRAWRWRTHDLAGWQWGRGLSGFVHGLGVAWERECSHVGVCAYACESVHVCLTTYGCRFKHMCTYSHVCLCAWLRMSVWLHIGAYVCLTTYGCTFKHVCTHSYVCLCAWLRMSVWLRIGAYVCLTTYGVGLSTCVRTVMFVFVRGYAWVCDYVSVRMYVRVCVCSCHLCTVLCSHVGENVYIFV